MHVVGAHLLRKRWERDRGAEGPLRALHAVLSEGSWTCTEEFEKALGRLLERGEDGAFTASPVGAGARIRLRANWAAGVICIEEVEAAED